MQPHPFRPDPDVPTVCAEPCGMPAANRVHQAQAHGAAPPPITASVNVAFAGTGTSRDAAVASIPGSESARRRVLDLVADSHDAGITDGELVASLPTVKPNTLRPRRIDLLREGWIEPARDTDGDVIVRGGFQVWVLTAAARDALAAA